MPWDTFNQDLELDVATMSNEQLEDHLDCLNTEYRHPYRSMSYNRIRQRVNAVEMEKFRRKRGEQRPLEGAG